MAKNKIILIFLLWISLITYNPLYSKSSYTCVKAIAEKEVGTIEVGGNNKGSRVKEYLASVNLPEGYAWCAAFVHWVFDKAGVQHTITAWSPTSYNKKDVIYTEGEFKTTFSENDIMVMSLSYSKFKKDKSRFKGIGHTGIVKKIKSKSVDTWEGNTNDAGTRDSRVGDGVYRKNRLLNKNIHITRWKKVNI
jgi:hypothetical protein